MKQIAATQYVLSVNSFSRAKTIQEELRKEKYATRIQSIPGGYAIYKSQRRQH